MHSDVDEFEDAQSLAAYFDELDRQHTIPRAQRILEALNKALPA